MHIRSPIVTIALVALAVSIVDASAFDEAQYPNFKGQWRSVGGPMRFDPSKPWGSRQGEPQSHSR